MLKKLCIFLLALAALSGNVMPTLSLTVFAAEEKQTDGKKRRLTKDERKKAREEARKKAKEEREKQAQRRNGKKSKEKEKTPEELRAQEEKEEKRVVERRLKEFFRPLSSPRASSREKAAIETLANAIAQESGVTEVTRTVIIARQGAISHLKLSDQFRRFSPDVQQQLILLINRANTAAISEGRVQLDGKIGDKGTYSIFVFFDSNEGGAGTAVSVNFEPRISTQPQGIKRSPAVDSRTGKPYLSVSQSVLKSLSAEDRQYVSFFVYSINDAIHYYFGSPLPPTNLKAWIAGKYLGKTFPKAACLLFRRTNAQAAVYQSSVTDNELETLSKVFPVQKKVFDDITAYVRDNFDSKYAALPNAQKKRTDQSLPCHLIPLWGSKLEEEEFYPSVEDAMATSCKTYELNGHAPCLELVVENRVLAAKKFLEELKEMRDFLVRRDFSSPALEDTPKGRAMSAVFTQIDEVSAELSELLQTNAPNLTAERKADVCPLGIYAEDPWTIIDPKGRSRKAYAKRLNSYERNFPHILQGEPMLIEGLRRSAKRIEARVSEGKMRKRSK